MPACMNTDQVGDNTESRQGDDVNLGMSEKPEQVLKQYWAAAAVAKMLAHLDNYRHEEAGFQNPVQGHHHCADE